MDPIFVYGTLKRGEGNNPLLRRGRAEFVGEAVTSQTYLMWSGGFPWIVPSRAESSGRILGEVWMVDDATMARLDALEGNGHMYQRQLLPVTLTERRARERSGLLGAFHAQGYIWLREHGGRIVRPDGSGIIDWKGGAW